MIEEFTQGMKADVNLIDFDNLDVTSLRTNDLPAGGKRVIQKSKGYFKTFVRIEVYNEFGFTEDFQEGW